MTLQEFKRSFRFNSTGQNFGDNYLVITQVIRRNDNKIIGGVKTAIDIFKTNDFIADSNSPTSLTPWNWDLIIDETIRGQMDFFAQRIPIENFLPLNKETNIKDLQ